MGPLCCQLADVESLLHNKVMNGVCAAKVEAEQLEGQQPPHIQYLGLLQWVSGFHIAVVVHVRADEVQAEGAQERGQHVNHRKHAYSG